MTAMPTSSQNPSQICAKIKVENIHSGCANNIKVWYAGRQTPSVACIVQPGSPGGFQKLFFGAEEIAIPVYGR